MMPSVVKTMDRRHTGRGNLLPVYSVSHPKQDELDENGLYQE